MACSVLLFAAVGQVQAAPIVYDNGTFITNGWGGISSAAVADDFTLPAGGSFDTLRIWLADAPASPSLSNYGGTIGWAIHDDNIGVPGAILQRGASSVVSLIDTGIDNVSGSRIFQADVPLGATALSAGTYWLHFREGLIGSVFDGTQVILLDSAGPVIGIGQRIDGDPVNPVFANSFNGNSAFQLLQVEPVPEPTSVALWGIGLLGMAGFVAHRCRNR